MSNPRNTTKRRKATQPAKPPTPVDTLIAIGEKHLALDLRDLRGDATVECTEIFAALQAAFAAGMDAQARQPRSCRECGCTDADCSGCIARTGQPCHWIEPDLCSACAPRPSEKKASNAARPFACYSEITGRLLGTMKGKSALRQWPMGDVLILDAQGNPYQIRNRARRGMVLERAQGKSAEIILKGFSQLRTMRGMKPSDPVRAAAVAFRDPAKAIANDNK